MTKLEEARYELTKLLAAVGAGEIIKTRKWAAALDNYARAARDEEADTLLRAAELRLQYNDYQEPLFTWHEVQDFLGAIRARISARAKEGK